MSIKTEAIPIDEYLSTLRKKAPEGTTVKEFISGMCREDIEYEYATLLLLCVNLTRSSSYRLAQD